MQSMFQTTHICMNLQRLKYYVRSFAIIAINSLFFFKIKSMTEYLALTNRLYLPRHLRFSEAFMDDVSTLASSLTSEIISRTAKDFRLAQVRLAL